MGFCLNIRETLLELNDGLADASTKFWQAPSKDQESKHQNDRQFPTTKVEEGEIDLLRWDQCVECGHGRAPCRCAANHTQIPYLASYFRGAAGYDHNMQGRKLLRGISTIALSVTGAVGLIGLIGLIGALGCEAPPEKVANFARPLAPGECALRKLAPGEAWPDLSNAWYARDAYLEEALAQDQSWYEKISNAKPSSGKPSTENRFSTMFPFPDVCTLEQASSSVVAFRQLLIESADQAAFSNALAQMFDCWQTKGWDGNGGVLFTGYYAPEFKASLTKAAGFEYPIYTRPKDLETDRISGKALGRRVSESEIVPWPTRSEIQSSGMFQGSELAWFPTALDAYIVQTNGSAKLLLPDGTVMFIGYAGATDGEYVGVGATLVANGKIPAEGLSLSAIRRLSQSDPESVSAAINLNNRFVFFQQYDGGAWPAGSLGVKVTDKVSLATDKSVYPPGGVMFVNTHATSASGKRQQFQRFMLDQDTGGAIRAPGRADIFMGIGPSAEILAGGQYCEGTLYYFFLKPEYVSQYPLPARKSVPKSGSIAKSNAG